MGVHKTKVRLAVQFESILQLQYKLLLPLSTCVLSEKVLGDLLVIFL